MALTCKWNCSLPACSFVPASIPRVRRLQTVAVALWTSMIPICFSFTLLLLYVYIYAFTVENQPSLKLVVAMVAAYSSYPPLWPFLLVYMIWIHIDSAPEHGGRLSPWFRSIRFWKFFAEYYPASYVYFTLTLAHCVDPPHPHQGIRRQAWHLSPLVCSFKRFFRSAISRQIGRICLVITLMVCLHIYDARISSLKTSLSLGIISM